MPHAGDALNLLRLRSHLLQRLNLIRVVRVDLALEVLQPVAQLVPPIVHDAGAVSLRPGADPRRVMVCLRTFMRLIAERHALVLVAFPGVTRHGIDGRRVNVTIRDASFEGAKARGRALGFTRVVRCERFRTARLPRKSLTVRPTRADLILNFAFSSRGSSKGADCLAPRQYERGYGGGHSRGRPRGVLARAAAGVRARGFIPQMQRPRDEAGSDLPPGFVPIRGHRRVRWGQVRIVDARQEAREGPRGQG